MNKQELMENYTMEQLADKIVALEITISDMKNTEKIIKQYNSKQHDCGNVEVIIKCPDCGKENKFELDEKLSQLIRDKLIDKAHILEDENNRLKDEVHKQKNIIDLIDDILENLFGITHDVGKPNEFEQKLKEKISSYEIKIDKLEKELEYKDGTKMFEILMENTDGEAADLLAQHMFENLKCVRTNTRMADDVSIADFLPAEPIKVANILISTEGECKPLILGNNVYKDTYKIFNVSELRQIAEHLLVYCNANGRENNEYRY